MYRPEPFAQRERCMALSWVAPQEDLLSRHSIRMLGQVFCFSEELQPNKYFIKRRRSP